MLAWALGDLMISIVEMKQSGLCDFFKPAKRLVAEPAAGGGLDDGGGGLDDGGGDNENGGGDSENQLEESEKKLLSEDTGRVSAIVLSPVTSQRALLNGLDVSERAVLYRQLLTVLKPRNGYPKLAPGILEQMRSLRSPHSNRDGQFYLRWARCLVIPSRAEGYPRLQVRLDQGPQSVCGRLKRLLSSVTMTKIFELGGSSNYFRVQAHHVAYISRDAAATIPSNCGAGGSISHLCDIKRCVNPRHLEATPSHRENMDRQRCGGVTLIVFENMILKDLACAHGYGGDAQKIIETSCIGITIVTLGRAEIIGILEPIRKNESTSYVGGV